jgi:hypothetical protein
MRIDVMSLEERLLEYSKDCEISSKFANDLEKAANTIFELKDAMQTVVTAWTSQFERNHSAPSWVRKAREVLNKSIDA